MIIFNLKLYLYQKKNKIKKNKDANVSDSAFKRVEH